MLALDFTTSWLFFLLYICVCRTILIRHRSVKYFVHYALQFCLHRTFLPSASYLPSAPASVGHVMPKSFFGATSDQNLLREDTGSYRLTVSRDKPRNIYTERKLRSSEKNSFVPVPLSSLLPHFLVCGDVTNTCSDAPDFYAWSWSYRYHLNFERVVLELCRVWCVML